MKRKDALHTLIKNHMKEFLELVKKYRVHVPRAEARRHARQEITRKYRAEYQMLCKAPTPK